MSAAHDPKPYSQLVINAWTALCLILSAVFLGMFVFGTQLLNAGHWIWDLIRYLNSPII